MNKDLFLKKASDSIKQEGIIIKGLNILKEVINSFNGKIYNRRVINQVNEKVRLTTNCHFNKSEYNDNDLYIYVPQMGNIGGNRVYIKMVVDSNNRINSELTIKEVEENDDASSITLNSSNVEYIGDGYLLNLIADFSQDIYKLVITELSKKEKDNDEE